jgi:hypothetical protein
MRGGRKTREEDATRERQHFSLWLWSKVKPHFISSLQPQSGHSLTTSVHRISPHEMLDTGRLIQESHSIFDNNLADLTNNRPQNGIATNDEAAA